MKRLLIVSLLFLSAVAAKATVTINLGAGTLYDTNASAPEATGMLIQLIASTSDSVFTAPTPGSYTGGSADDVVIFSFSVNNALGSPGTFLDSLKITLANYPGLAPGAPILLRWFPTIAGPASFTATLPPGPAAGAHYGQFRTDIVEANNFSNFAWFMPADGATIDLNFLTMAQNAASTHPESDGFANLVVIPEPTTYALLVVGLASAAFVRRRTKAT